MSSANSAIVDPRADFWVDNRGYIHGGFDTPIFGKVKQKHNSRLTAKKHERRRKKEDTEKLANTLIKVMKMPEMSHIVKETS